MRPAPTIATSGRPRGLTRSRTTGRTLPIHAENRHACGDIGEERTGVGGTAGSESGMILDQWRSLRSGRGQCQGLARQVLARQCGGRRPAPPPHRRAATTTSEAQPDSETWTAYAKAQQRAVAAVPVRRHDDDARTVAVRPIGAVIAVVGVVVVVVVVVVAVAI